MPNQFAPKGFLTIAEMAGFTGVSYRTLRFYEERELLRPHRIGLARYYSPQDRIRVDLIIKAKRLGFSLREIERLISEAGAATSEPPSEVVSTLTKDELVRQIDQLTERREGVQTAIDELIAALADKGSPDNS